MPLVPSVPPLLPPPPQVQQRDLTIRRVKETEKELGRQLRQQRDHYEATIQRHLSFIDQVPPPRQSGTGEEGPGPAGPRGSLGSRLAWAARTLLDPRGFLAGLLLPCVETAASSVWELLDGPAQGVTGCSPGGHVPRPRPLSTSAGSCSLGPRGAREGRGGEVSGHRGRPPSQGSHLSPGP